MFLLLILLFVAPAAAQEAKLIVNVRNQVGFPVTDLKAEDFVIAGRQVQQARYVADPLVDAVLLVETSEVGKRMRGDVEQVASLFIDRLGDKNEMALAGYATSADLVQDFTASKSLLRRALSTLQYGNPPCLLDAIFAVIDGAYEHSAGRRVLVVIGSGADAGDKVNRKEVIEAARRNGVSIYAIVLDRDFDLEELARQTAGDYYRGRGLKQIQTVVENINASFRGHYELVLTGDFDKLKVEVPKGEQYHVSWRVQ